MNTIEVFSKDECILCDEAREMLRRLQKEFQFEISETKLTSDHSLYSEYKNSFPVIAAWNGGKISGRMTEDDLRRFLRSLCVRPRTYYAAKFLEALGIVVVFFGFMYGLFGDMWADLYFFLGGIVFFVIGWGIEKAEARRRTKSGTQAS